MMDYNMWQSALTPCQIGTVQKNFSRLNSLQRKLLVKQWCHYNDKETILVSDTVVLYGARDLNKSVHILEGGYLEVKCRISLPPSSSIKVDPGGTLVLDAAHLHNDCGKKWSGIMAGHSKKGSALLIKKGKVLVEDVLSQTPESRP